jgi:glycolate oxidase iron-sulfur subunit
MQTRFSPEFLNTPDGKLAEGILRACVHCGFCTATCPTFLQTGNELDSPRGRIYLIKEMLENDTASSITARHLDRCLACRSCETTCPSNVQYHTLLDLGRAQVKKHHRPAPWQAFMKQVLLSILSNRVLFGLGVKIGRALRFLLPRTLASQLPGKSRFTTHQASTTHLQTGHQRKVVLLEGCVQSSLSPDTNTAARMVLDHLKIDTISIRQESCCGAMHFHTDAQQAGLDQARKLIQQMEQAIEQGAEAIISTASGCGSFIKDYPAVLGNDTEYLKKARHLLGFVKDIGEFLLSEDVAPLKLQNSKVLAFHSPCSLQHGQKLAGKTELLLTKLGITVPTVPDAHLCCGSAGTYSLFHAEMADKLRGDKLKHLQQISGEGIATANIGCQCHLAAKASMPVRHWVEHIADELAARR